MKNILALGVLSLTSYSIFKWIDINKPLDIKELWNKQDTIAELAELIIPATDTPGAKDASVHQYIINVLINCNSLRQQHIFLTGLEDLEQYTIENHGKEFLSCSLREKEAVLKYFAVPPDYHFKIINKIHNKFWGETFYSKLRDLTVEGYCFSKPGATRGLAYDYIPGKYEACIPIKANQKSWATK